MIRIVMLSVALAIMLGASQAAHAIEHTPSMVFAGGVIGVKAKDDYDDNQWLGVEYRWQPIRFWGLVPSVGIAAALNGSAYLYHDLGREFAVGDTWYVRLSSGPGLFRNDGDIDLGSTLQFRTGIEVGARLRNKGRIGLVIHHLSNASTSSKNPGTETLTLLFAMPL